MLNYLQTMVYKLLFLKKSNSKCYVKKLPSHCLAKYNQTQKLFDIEYSWTDNRNHQFHDYPVVYTV